MRSFLKAVTFSSGRLKNCAIFWRLGMREPFSKKLCGNKILPAGSASTQRFLTHHIPPSTVNNPSLMPTCCPENTEAVYGLMPIKQRPCGLEKLRNAAIAQDLNHFRASGSINEESKIFCCPKVIEGASVAGTTIS